MATPISAKGTTFTFGGTSVGGIEKYIFFEGVAREPVHRPLKGHAAFARPPAPDFGRCVLELYRDKADPGQVKLLNSLKNRVVENCVLTYADGTTENFEAFCLILPVAGSKSGSGSNRSNMSKVTLRVTGPIS